MTINIPKILFITGADGVGKSKISLWLLEHLSAQGIKAGLVWSRFSNFTSKPFLALARLSGHSFYKNFNEIVFGFHNFENLGKVRYLFASLQAIDVNIATFKNIKSKKKKYDVIVCERGPWDTLADVIADTDLKFLFKRSVSKLYTMQTNNDSKVFMIKRSKAKILESRPELIYDYKLDRKIDIYDRLAEINNWLTINNDKSFEDTQKKIASLIKKK